MDEILRHLRRFLGRVREDAEARRKLAASGILAAVLGAIAWMTLGPRQGALKPLFSELAAQDAGAIAAQLDEDGIPYEVGGDGGTILVAEADVHRTRLKVAAAGLPRGGQVGFDLFDRATLPSTRFVQDITYQRALEGELARTISTIDAVRSARVHVVMPEKRLFKEDQERASASVTLVLHPDRTLTPRQARSVQHLVAAAVKGLEPDQVSVFANGNLLTTSGEQAGAAVTLEVKREMEERVQQDVRAILERRVGAGKVLVRVNMELSGREVKTRREELDADGQVVGSETVTEDRSTRGGRPRGAEGASGAAENLPGATGGVGTGSADNVRTRSRTVFQTPTTVTEVVEPAGRVERMTVAVLVDGEYGPAPGEAASATPPADASGDAAAMNYRPRSDTELAAIRELVIDAAGLDLDRGDRITVQSMQFADAAIAPKPGVEAVDSPWLRLAPVATRALVALVAIALVALLLVRPLVRWLTTPTPVTGGAAHALGDGAGRGAPAGARALTAGEGADSREPGVADHPDTPSFDVLNARELRAFAQRNMDRTVQVVREWAQDT